MGLSLYLLIVLILFLPKFVRLFPRGIMYPVFHALFPPPEMFQFIPVPLKIAHPELDETLQTFPCCLLSYSTPLS